MRLLLDRFDPRREIKVLLMVQRGKSRGQTREHFPEARISQLRLPRCVVPDAFLLVSINDVFFRIWPETPSLPLLRPLGRVRDDLGLAALR